MEAVNVRMRLKHLSFKQTLQYCVTNANEKHMYMYNICQLIADIISLISISISTKGKSFSQNVNINNGQ